MNGTIDWVHSGEATFGTENHKSGELALKILYPPGDVRCGDVELNEYLDAWGTLPPFLPPTDQ